LNITQRDESGWWYGKKDDGTLGFIPETYVDSENVVPIE